MKIKLVSLLKISLGIFIVCAATQASAEYYLVYTPDCGCFAPPPEYVSYYPRHHSYHRYHRYHRYSGCHRPYRHHYWTSNRRRSSYHISVYYVWQAYPAPACDVPSCGAPSPCGSSSCGVSYVPDSTFRDSSETGNFDYDMRTRDDVY